MNAPAYQPIRPPNGILGDQCKPQVERDVPAAIGKIRFSLEQLGVAVDKLRQRVDPLIQNRPADPAVKAEPAVVRAPLAVTIDEFANRILDYQRAISAMDEDIQI